MALMFHSPPSSVTSKPYQILSGPKPKFTVKSQTPSQPPKPAIDEPSDDRASAKKPASPGLGFGSNSSSSSKSNSSTVSSNSRKKHKIKRERASIIRREPAEKPDFFSQEDKVKAEEQSKNESAFLLTWLGLGGVILVQGIVLAASGFLPEEWDKFFVKYLYPAFTPTVFLFVAGTVTYGVLKYLQNEKPEGQK